MIDIRSAYINAYLQNISERAAITADAHDWLDGTQTFYASELVPPFEEGSEGQLAWQRFIKQVQSLGPRALRFKRDGTLGNVNWGGDDPSGIDERLQAVDLRSLAGGSLKSLLGSGIAAAWAYKPEEDAEPRIQRLGGHVEPLYAEDDAAGEVLGLYQVRAQAGPEVRYKIRVYDFETSTIFEWANARSAFELGKPPTSIFENASMPRYQLADKAQDGLPIGEATQALPLLKAEVAQQIRILRAADAHAWPLMWAVGDWDLGKKFGATTVLTATGDASIGRLEPGNLDSLFTQQDRLLERFRCDLSLPISSISGGNFPSGEALEQANAAFLSSCRHYALLLSRLLSDVVGDFAELHGIAREEAPPVSVSVNRETARIAISKQVREDFDAGIVSRRAAATAISVYYPDWSDEDLEEFLLEKEEQRTVIPGMLARADDPPVNGVPE